MNTRTFITEYGSIQYWVNDFREERKSLIFLPGLTADHRLFDKQILYFKNKYNCLVWDAPGHGASMNFRLKFSLKDKAEFLHDILESEKIKEPVFIGQSMGGYVAQMFAELYPDIAAGFVFIDSAPLKKQYITAFELWALKHVEPVYRIYPWKSLMKAGSKGCSDSAYGRQLMIDMMKNYEKKYYCKLAGHGFRILAEAIEEDREYEINCPAILICGENDRAGSAKRYNKAWAQNTSLPLYLIENAGHNSNNDQPEKVNKIIEKFISGLL